MPFIDRINRILRYLLISFAILILPLFIIVPYYLQAFEDAVILFQYSTNLARNGVISFYVGGAHTEGATDFLWMVLLALGRKLGLEVFFLADIISAVSVCMICVILLRIADRKASLSSVLLLCGVAFLAPQTVAALGGFSVFPFGLLLASLVWSLVRSRYAAACLAGLLLCLFRPDGVVFALPLLAMFLFEGKRITQKICHLACYFILPGLCYFIWRWHYFHALLPLPFLVKSDTPRVLGLFVPTTVVQQYKTIILSVFLILIACRSSLKKSINVKLVSGLIVIPTFFYFGMRLDQDVAGRFFFYPLLSVGLILAVNYSEVRIRARFLLPAGVALAVLIFARNYSVQAMTLIQSRNLPEAKVAHDLSLLPKRGSMIVTEAGIIPFYSGWIAYDPWGLNTVEFASKIIQPRDVARLAPDLIIVHRDDSTPCVRGRDWQVPYSARSWTNMERNLISGASSGPYEEWLMPRLLVNPPSLPWKKEDKPRYGYVCWYVRGGTADKLEIESILKRNGAVLFLTGK